MRLPAKARPFLAVAVLLCALLAGGAVRQVQDTCGPFTDVSALFCPYVLEAYYTGITAGTSSTTFSPDIPITRGQGAVFTTKALNQALARGSRRAALGRWWTTQNSHAFGLTSVPTPTFVASDGTDVWVASGPNGSVTRVRGSDGGILGTWSGMPDVNGLLPAMGLILVTTGTNLYAIDPSQPQGTSSVVATGLGIAAGAGAFDGQNIWTVNVGSISIISPGSSNPWPVQNLTQGFSQVGGIVFDGSNVWVGNSGGNSLLRLDPNGTILQTVTLSAPPTSILYDGINLWVTLSSANLVGIVRASTGTVLTYLSGNGLNYPNGLAFDGERVMVTSFYENVSIFRAVDFQPLASVSTIPFSDPISVCSDGLNFWIAMSTTEQLVRF